ncbi:hypothetical protein BH09BAC1_BH09BAC1_26330 [soil metagenome]
MTEAREIKLAKTQNPVHEVIRERWSARSFQAKPIEQQDLDTLFEAASWAPSSNNEQPWAYIYALHGTPTFEAMWHILMPGNQPWAQHAGVLIASLARKTHANTGAPNKYAWYDTGSANQNLLLQAASMGILGHVMGGFHHEQALELLQLPNDYELLCFVALGYPNAAEELEEPFRTRELTPRSRKPVHTFVFQDRINS